MGKHRKVTPLGDHEVGYKRPPKSGQFPKGQSGFAGRSKTRKTTLADDLAAELAELVTVTENGKPVTMTKQRLLAKQTVSGAIKGSTRAAIFINNVLANGARADGEDGDIAGLAPDDQAIVQAFLTGLQVGEEVTSDV